MTFTWPNWYTQPYPYQYVFEALYLCPHCGWYYTGWHTCPCTHSKASIEPSRKIHEIEYYPDGSVKRVVYTE